MNRCLPITRSKTNRPTTLSPACAFHTRPGCASTNFVADGNASFCASAIDRYCTAWADDVIEMIAAAGAVHLIHSAIVGLLPFDHRPAALVSEEESDAAQDGIGIGAGRILVDHLLVVRLEHELGRREDGHPS